MTAPKGHGDTDYYDGHLSQSRNRQPHHSAQYRVHDQTEPQFSLIPASLFISPSHQQLRTDSTLDTALWITAGILAAIYLMAGITKTLRPRASLADMMAWTKTSSDGMVKFVGVVEILGALGLVLPWLTGIAPILTPIAAACFVLVQVLAIAVHIRINDLKPLPLNVVLLLAALFVAIFRFQGI